MGIVAKNNIDPDDIYFDAMLTPAQVTALPANLSEKKPEGIGEKLKSNLYLFIGDEAQRIFKAIQPVLAIKTERCPRVLNHMEHVFKRERNIAYKRGLFYRCEQRKNNFFLKNSTLNYANEAIGPINHIQKKPASKAQHINTMQEPVGNIRRGTESFRKWDRGGRRTEWGEQTLLMLMLRCV